MTIGGQRESSSVAITTRNASSSSGIPSGILALSGLMLLQALLDDKECEGWEDDEVTAS